MAKKNDSFEKWMQEAYATTGGKGAGFVTDSKGNAGYQTYQTGSSGKNDSFQKWMQDAYAVTGGKGAGFAESTTPGTFSYYKWTPGQFARRQAYEWKNSDEGKAYTKVHNYQEAVAPLQEKKTAIEKELRGMVTITNNTIATTHRRQELEAQLAEVEDQIAALGENPWREYAPYTEQGRAFLSAEQASTEYQEQLTALQARKDEFEKQKRALWNSDSPAANMRQIKYLNEQIDAIDEQIRALGDDPWHTYGLQVKALERKGFLSGTEYADILNRPDYAEKSAAGESKTAGRLFGTDQTYDYINNINGFRQRQDAQMRSGDMASYKQMTDDEIGVYNYIYATEGRKAADEFLKSLKVSLDEADYLDNQEVLRKVLEESTGLGKAALSAATVLATPGRTVSSIGALADDIINTATGQGINPYSRWRRMSLNTQDIRQQIGSGMSEAGNFVYQTVMSAGDSAMNMLLAGGLGAGAGAASTEAVMRATNILGSTLMSNEVASLAIADAKQRGYSDAAAVGIGLIRGGIEALTEMVGGEAVIGMIKANPLNFAKSMALAMMPEGVEEVGSDALNGIVNILMDNLFGTEESDYATKIYNYRKQGVKNPELKAFGELIGDEALSFLGGAMATFGTAGVQTMNVRTGINATAELLHATPAEIVSLMEEIGQEDAEKLYRLARYKEATSIEDLKEKLGGDLSAVKEDVDKAVETAREEAVERREIDIALDGLDISDEERKVLMSGRETGTADAATYGIGVREAFQLGQKGFTLEQAIGVAKHAGVLNETQFRHAWQMGAMRNTAEKTTADTATEEGRDALETKLNTLGSHASEAAAVYEEGQDVSTFAAAMNKAVNLYAAFGKDLTKIVQDVRDGKSSDIVGRLTDKQVETAIRIGAAVRAEQQALTKDLAKKRAEIREQAAALRAGETPKVSSIRALIRDANDVGRKALAAYQEQLAAFDQLVKDNPEAEGREEYNRLYDAAMENRNKALEAQKEIDRLQEQLNEAQKEKPDVTEKKGTVTVADKNGRIGGMRYEAVDEENLSKQQKTILDAVRLIADTIGLDITVVKAEGTFGGAYIGGGRIYLNIYSGMNLRSFSKAIAAGSMGHEMVHWLQEYAPEQYEELKQYVIDSMSAEKLDELVREQMRTEPNLTPSGALDEVVANACQPLLLNSKAFEQFAREHMTVAEKIVEFVKQFVSKIKEAFAEIDFHDNLPIYHAVQAVEDRLGEMQEYFDRALIAARENYQAERIVRRAGGEKKNAAGEGDVKYSIVNTRGMTWEEQTEAYFKKKLKSSDSLYLGTSFGFIKGVRSSPMYVPTSVITKAMREQKGSRSAHRMEQDDIENLGAGISKPVAVIYNPSRNAIVYIAQDSVAGHPVVVAFDINNNLYGENAHKATSIHPRESVVPMLTGLGEDATVYVLNENKFNDLTGLQSDNPPVLLANVEPVKSSIANAEEESKGQNQVFSEDFGPDTATERNGRELAQSRLQNENTIMRQTIAELNKTIKKMNAAAKRQDATIGELHRQLRISKPQEVRRADAKRFAKELVGHYGSTADVDDVTNDLVEIGNYLLNAKEIDEEKLRGMARSLAEFITRNVWEELPEVNEDARKAAKDIRGRKLSIDEADTGEIGDFNLWRKRQFGKFTVAKRRHNTLEGRPGYVSVAQFYEDMASTYGRGLFPESAVNEGEMLKNIAEVFEAAEPQGYNPVGPYFAEAVEETANKILDNAMQGILRPDLTTADKWQARTQALQQRIKELRDEAKLGEKEASRLYATIYDLSVALDKAESRYETLRQEANYRTAQIRAEGSARVQEVRALERAKATERITALRDYYRTMISDAREKRNESAGIAKYRKQVEKKAKALYELLMTNSDAKHVPEVLKAPLGEFLETLDFSSKRSLSGGNETRNDQKFGARLQKLQQMLERQRRYLEGETDMAEDLGGYIDVAPDVMEELREMSARITEAMALGRTFTINSMSAEDLKTLSKFLSNLKTAITGMNLFMANARYTQVREAASADTDYMKSLGKASEADNSGAARFAMWENGVPYYIFKRFGQGARSIFDGFTRGWEKMAMNAQKVIKFAENTYTNKEVRAWKAETHDITLEDGSEIRMTTSQIMELAMLLNREQARKHIAHGGIRIGDIKTKKGTAHDTAHYHLTEADIENIVGLLNGRQLAVAKELQHFMAVQGAEWGNEISMRRFGYRFYEEGDAYYPIKTDSNDRPMADTDAQNNSMFRLLNLSASKSLNPRASNALIVGDIFDTFADHMSDMTKLNGMGLSILDAIKWFNYKERINHEDGTYDTRTLQGAMEQAFGKQAQRYFRTLMKDINGQSETGDRGTGVAKWLLGNYKAAAVAANLRVALLQPTSYIRAQTVLRKRYLAAAFGMRNGYQEAMKYSGTAVWKSLGYYDTDIARGIASQITHDEGLRDKIVEKSMVLAELGDKRTWGRLWNACKLQVKAENEALTGEELMQATADLFREVIYSSQVMDATLTRSEIMRGKGLYSKMASAFMAEPTLSYNILLDAASEYELDVRQHGKAGAWQRNSERIGRALTVYVSSAAFAAVVESLMDAMRDDDDESYWDKFLQAFIGEDGKWWTGNLAQDLTILGKLPIVKDAISMIQGYSSTNMATGAFTSVVDAVKIWLETYKLANGMLDKATKITSYGKMTEWGKIYKTLQALSQMSGIAVSNMTRDVIAIWNTMMNGRKDEWKIRRYDSNALSQTKINLWKQDLKPLGITKDQYQTFLREADTDGSGSLKQDEAGAWLNEAVRNGELTQEQAAAMWSAASSTWKKTLDEWSGAGAMTVSEQETTDAPTLGTLSAPTIGTVSTATVGSDYESWRKGVHLYSDKKEQAYQLWDSTVRPLGVDLNTYTGIINAADAAGDGNGSVKQDEMGVILWNQVQSGQLTQEQADAIWRTIWNGARSKSFSKWLRSQ